MVKFVRNYSIAGIALVSAFVVTEAHASDLINIVDSINTRLSQFQLINVPVPVLVDKNVVAAYEFRRVGQADAPVIIFQPRQYLFSYNLTQDPTRYAVKDFCEAIHYTKYPNKLKFADIAAKLGNDREGEVARLAREGVVEIALAAYAAGVALLESGYRSQVSLLGTALADPSEPPDGLYSTPAAHHAFGVLSPLSPYTGRPLWYRDLEKYYAFDGGYFYRDIPNLRSAEFFDKIMLPIMSICKEPSSDLRILDGVLVPNDKYPDAVRVYLHIFR